METFFYCAQTGDVKTIEEVGGRFAPDVFRMPVAQKTSYLEDTDPHGALLHEELIYERVKFVFAPGLSKEQQLNQVKSWGMDRWSSNDRAPIYRPIDFR